MGKKYEDWLAASREKKAAMEDHAGAMGGATEEKLNATRDRAFNASDEEQRTWVRWRADTEG